MFTRKRKSFHDNDSSFNDEQVKKRNGQTNGRKTGSSEYESQSEFSSQIRIEKENVGTSEKINEVLMKKSSIESKKSVWSKEEDKILMDSVRTMFSKNSRKSFRKELKRVNYAEIKSSLFLKSENECKERLELLVKKSTQFRNLYQVLEDVLNRYPTLKFNDRPMKRFFADYKFEIDQYHKNTGYKCKMKSAVELYSNLSPKEKMKYRSIKCSSGNVLNIAKSAYNIFVEKTLGEPGNTMPKVSHQFKNLPDSELLEYLLESLNTLDAELKYYNENNADNSQKIKLDNSKCPNRYQLKLLLQHFELPIFEFDDVTMYYYNRKYSSVVTPSKKISSYANQMFEALPPLKKNKWIIKYTKEKEIYEKKMEEWKSTVSPALLRLYERSKRPKCKKEMEKKFWIEVDKPPIIMTFPNEPKIPPMTPKQLYNFQMKKLRKPIQNIANIDDSQLKELKQSLQLIIERYKEKILEFVKDLPLEQKKYYIGIRRKYFYRIFKNVDIFEDTYSIIDFPCYNDKKIVVKDESKTFDDFLINALENVKDVIEDASENKNNLSETFSEISLISSSFDEEDEDDN